jgi:hypothetical protein
MENVAPVDGWGIEVKIKNGKKQTLRNDVSWAPSIDVCSAALRWRRLKPTPL